MKRLQPRGGGVASQLKRALLLISRPRCRLGVVVPAARSIVDRLRRRTDGEKRRVSSLHNRSAC